MITVNGQRLREDIETNATFGAIDADEGRGRTNLTGTPANRQAREYLVERMAQIDLSIHVDAVGNIAGTWKPPSATESAAPVATGSHLDSVPDGGIFDGPLGVYAGLEAVRAMQDNELAPDRPITVISFTEEEGSRFGDGLLGSSVAAGIRDLESALETTDENGRTLNEALRDIEFAGEERLDAEEWDAWIELHIEQDTTLETNGTTVGIVDDITGIAQYEVEVEGSADHAGTTNMRDRDDALAATAEIVSDVEHAAWEIVTSESETAVATVGDLKVTPNARNVIPGHVQFGVDVRDVEVSSMEYLGDRLAKSLARHGEQRSIETAMSQQLSVDPTPMSHRCRSVLQSAATATGHSWQSLHSGAAHDTMHVARCTDAGLLFAPSSGGVSHSPREWTDWDDCTAATEVLATAVADLAGA